MFARTEDVAHLVGADGAIAEGAILRNLQRMLDSFWPIRNAGTMDQ